MERLMFGWDFEVDAWSRFLRWNLIKICIWTCDMNSTLGSVVPLAMFALSACLSLFAWCCCYLSMNLVVAIIAICIWPFKWAFAQLHRLEQTYLIRKSLVGQRVFYLIRPFSPLLPWLTSVCERGSVGFRKLPRYLHRLAKAIALTF